MPNKRQFKKLKKNAYNPFKETKSTKRAKQTSEKYNLKTAGVKQGESLEAAWKRLAKQADQRLVRLEAYAHDENFNSVLRYAYARAMRDIQSFGGKKRFNARKPTNPQELRARINDILTFLNSPTSTKQGIIAVYQKRANSINKKYGTNFTWQQLADYFQSGKADKMNSKYGSDTALFLIATEQANLSVSDIAERSNARQKSTTDDEQMEKIIDRLSQGGVSARQLKQAQRQAVKLSKRKK